MNFKSVVKLSDLVVGDRFYFLGNKAKVVQVVKDIVSKKILSGYTYTAFVLEGVWEDKRVVQSAGARPLDVTKYIKHHEKAETIQVVFLRHEVAIA